MKKHVNTVLENYSEMENVTIMAAWKNQHPLMQWWLILSAFAYLGGSILLFVNF